MCLAVPGKIEEISGKTPETRIGRVSFGGIIKEVNLAFVPEAKEGEFVLVHVGFALTRIEEAEANRVFEYLQEIEGMDELTGDAS